MYQNQDVDVDQHQKVKRPLLNNQPISLKNKVDPVAQQKNVITMAVNKNENIKEPAEFSQKNLTLRMIVTIPAIEFPKTRKIQEMIQNSTPKNTINGNINFDL
jgi:ATP-dependent exoDNAse (exonuclease V) alpha subunit